MMRKKRFTKYNRNGIPKVNQEQPVPVGTIISFAGTTAPGGWLLCQGQEISRASYPQLDAVIKENFGSYTNGSGSAGSTHLRLPDMMGKIPIGSGTGARNSESGTGLITGGTSLTARTIGSTVGNSEITLSSNESGLPSHNHSVNQNNHTHTITDTAHSHSIGYSNVSLINTGTGTAFSDGSYRQAYNMVSSSAGWSNASSTSGITINTKTGESATSAHSNTPPVVVVSYIIKAL